MLDALRMSSLSDKHVGNNPTVIQPAGLQAAPAAVNTGTGGLARLSASCTTSSHKQDHSARMWFAACHYQKSFKTILQVHAYDPPANTDPIILAQQFPWSSHRYPGQQKKLPVAFASVCLSCLQWREKMPIPAQATCNRAWRDSLQ